MVVLLWLPLALPLVLGLGDPDRYTLPVMALLFALFLLVLPLWGRRVYDEPQLLQRYGLIWSRQSGWELLRGFGMGSGSLLLLFSLQGLLGWVHWQLPEATLLRLALEGLLVALGIGFAEELVFRGWVLDELERDYSPRQALLANSLIFALLHFIKPLPEAIRTFPQFPGLMLLALALVWAKRSTRSKVRTYRSVVLHAGRLGLPVGLHAGLVWGYYLIRVGQLVDYTARVPAWVTGIDGNPLAGITGLLFLTGLAAYWRHRSQLQGRRCGDPGQL